MAPTDKLASMLKGGESSSSSGENATTSSSEAQHPYLIPMPDLHKALKPEARAALKEVEEQFTLDAAALKEITDQMLWEYKTGLSTHVDDTNRDTFLPMIPTYVHAVPNGSETGVFLALDLGGTNLRVCEVNLLGDHKFTMRHDKYRVSDALKTGPATELFDFIAQCVESFISTLGTQEKKETNEPLYLGFTFSFPVQQTALDKGTLISWTKGFTATGAQGNDVVQLLQDALNRRQVNVKCAALVNDTVGTLLSHAYQSGAAVAGAIFGTGTNGAYLEKMSAITKDIPVTGNHEYMVVNTEWGAFDNERKVLRITPHDNKCDRKSVNPRKQAFEKMVSGMYIGEVVRNVLLQLIDHGHLFDGHSSNNLNRHYGLDTALMSALEGLPATVYCSAPPTSSDWKASIAETRKVLTQNLMIKDKYITDSDCLLVRRVSEIVGTRGARLAAVAVAATLIQTGYDQKDNSTGTLPEFSIGVDGSLVELYPHFEFRLRQALRDIVGSEVEKKVRLGLAKDGSGVGAALTALSAYKQAHAQPNAAFAT